jgi:DNA-binding SARP family transcriptional activator
MALRQKMRIHLFGNLMLSQQGKPVALAASVAPVICYLVVKRQRPVSRGELAGVIWPDRVDAKARRCLSTALWRLNQHPETAGLVDTSHHEFLHLDPQAAYWIDAIAFEYRIEALLRTPAEKLDDAQFRRLGAAVALYRDDLMRSSDLEWAQLERQRLRHLYLGALFHLTAAAAARGETSDAIAWGRRLTALEPLREDAHRLLMRIYVASGNRGKAIEQYRICQGELSTELNVEPTRETQALYASLIGEDADVTVASAADRRAASLEAVGARIRYARRVISAADLRLADAIALVNRAVRTTDHV